MRCVRYTYKRSCALSHAKWAQGDLAEAIGPDHLGRIPERSARILHEVGTWLRVNGESDGVEWWRGC